MDKQVHGSMCKIKIDQMPAIVMEKILSYLTYEELSHIRRTCKFFQLFAERALNEGFFRFGKQISRSCASIKKQLPRKESERRSHPLNRYAEIYSALETRYTLLSLTYKKYIDFRYCCFIPGKVLDVAFAIARQIDQYLVNNLNVALDVIRILRDIRDYSSMAMEHFDEHVAPRFPTRPMLPMFQPCSSADQNSPLLPRFCTIALASNKSYNKQYEEISSENCSKFQSFINEFRNKIEEQNRVIEEHRKIIHEQGRYIRQIVNFLGEMGKQYEWAPRLMDNFNRLSSNYRESTTNFINKKKRLPKISLKITKTIKKNDLHSSRYFFRERKNTKLNN